MGETADVMTQLKNGIKSIFEKIGCSSEAMAAHLGEQSSVTNVNVPNDLLQQFMLVNMRTDHDPKDLMNAQPAKSNAPPVAAPSFDENDAAVKDATSGSPSGEQIVA